MLQWTCLKCGHTVSCNPLAYRCLERAGACQGCRLAKTLSQAQPETVMAIAEYMERTNSWPESTSWVEALPVTGGYLQ